MSRRLENDSKTVVQRPQIDLAVVIPYSTPLYLPHADSVEVVGESLRLLQRRVKITGPIATHLPGARGLVRTIKLPPLSDPNKLVPAVRYEASQQIPFHLDNVEWRAQCIGTARYEKLCAHEVVFSAVKRDQLALLLDTFRAQNLHPDLVSLHPLSLMNYLWNTSLGMAVPPPDEFIVGLECGAESSTLIVTNGNEIWTKSIPLGGFHFSKLLSREMKLTTESAETLKCDAMAADDPKAVFVCLRPIYIDLLSEVERCLAFFAAHEENVKFSGIAFFGNGFLLPGLKLYLTRNLGIPELTIKPSQVFQGEALAREEMQEGFGGFVPAISLALERLRIGRVFMNFVPASGIRLRFKGIFARFCHTVETLPSGIIPKKAKRAWGIDIGTTALRAVCLTIP